MGRSTVSLQGFGKETGWFPPIRTSGASGANGVASRAMALRILHHGWFLREGFQALGCEVLPFRPDPRRTLDAQVEALGFSPDVVFLELFGDRPRLPKALHESRHRLAAYCVDSPLNEFWLAPLARLLDHVYVDQLASVPRFQAQGVAAAWLPLCVNESHFREPAREPAHFLTFVGRVSEFRAKRANLLAHIAARHPLHQAQGLTTEQMLDLFADSRVVLNENFFPGLNLRFLHALASGALLLTERGGLGVDRHFADGAHFLSYGPADVLDVLDRVRSAPDAFRDVARAGQELCRARHTSAARAAVVLEDLLAPAPGKRLSGAERGLAEAQAKYLRALRFGGDYTEAVRLLRAAAQDPDLAPSQALDLLGAMALRSGRTDEGLELLAQAATCSTPAGLDAALKLLAASETPEQARPWLARISGILHGLGLDQGKHAARMDRVGQGADLRHQARLLGCEVLLDLGRVFDPGFVKPEPERFPDTALEYALLAFGERKTPESLDAVVRCAEAAGLAAEALPQIHAAILEGAALDRHVALAASLSLEYYDFAAAETVMRSLKRKKTAARKSRA